MKKTLQRAVIFTASVLCALNLSAQSVLKVGNEVDKSIDVSQKNYQELSKKVLQNKSASGSERQVIYEEEFFSENSSYVKLYFENFDLAPGDYLEITGANIGESIIYGGLGKIIDQSGNMISNFWSRVMLDDKVTVKLYSSGDVGTHKGFEITKVAYGYSQEKIQKQLMASASQRAICSSDDKESIACYDGTEMFEKAKAVCRLLIGGSSLCTGWLLGSEGNLMTNNHCIGNSSDALNTDFMFNYQYSNCSETSNATTDVVASSATFIKTSSSLDYTLVQLPVNPTGTYGYLSLSSSIPSAGDRIYIPQHPGGRRKEISVTTDSGGTAAGFSSVFDTSLSNTQSVRYLADTEGGSSGSPVIDYNSNLVIAIHNTGGCPNGSYGRCDELISSIGSDMPNNGVDDSNGGGGGGGTTGCSSTVSSFPYSQSFESGDGWTQASGDDGDWTRDASGTPSSGTGPSAGADGSYYMFLEASTNGSTGQIGANATAILESPCFNLSGESQATFNFQNHMYGTSVGSLTLQVSTNEGSSWSSLWSSSGDQGNQWNEESVSLNAYAGQSSVQLRFVGTTGTSWSSDIAIDDLELTTSGGGTSDTSAPTTPSNVSASSVTQTSATISWSASSDNVGVTGYDVYQGNSLLGQTTNTSASISSLSAGTTYTFYIVAFDAAGNQSSAGSVTFTTTSSSGGGGGNLTYCDSEGSDSSYEWIDYVAFGGFTNTTGDDGGYADYTSNVANVSPGSTNTLIISAGFSSSSYTEYWKIWIDYDQNGTFDDDEVIASGSSSSADNLSVSVTIPTTASLGTTTMRVSMKYNAEQTACETFAYGEVEDYSVNISNSVARTESSYIDAEALGNEPMTSVMVYPNPAESYVKVSLSNRYTGIASYNLVNTIGQMVLNGNLKNQAIDISRLKRGIYILEVNDGQKIFTSKLIKE